MKKLSFILLIIALIQSNISAQWQQIEFGSTVELNSIFFIDENVGWIANSEGIVFKTTDSGANWESYYLGNNYNLRSVYFISDNLGFATDKNNIFKSEDGGQSWDAIKTDSNKNFSKIYFVNQNLGFVLGKKSIQKTTNSGESWVQKNIDTSIYEIKDVSFSDNNKGWLACNDYSGYLGKIYKTTDEGETWKIITSNFPYDGGLTHLAGFKNSDILYAGTSILSAGVLYFLYKSIDGGISWNGIGAQVAYLVFFASPDTGWIYGSVGIHTKHHLLQKTVDGGKNFINDQSLDIYPALNNMFFINNYLGWAVGYNGIILKTTNGGTTFINEYKNDAPKEFALYQNYPNPYNPETTISFSLSQSSNVELKIYDMLGKEITTLVNGYEEAGEHNVEFNGNGLSSGIYFYKIQAGEYSSVKKMILIK